MAEPDYIGLTGSIRLECWCLVDGFRPRHIYERFQCLLEF
jgi:hypothetical protein